MAIISFSFSLASVYYLIPFKFLNTIPISQSCFLLTESLKFGDSKSIGANIASSLTFLRC
jgi:hypothetical protein